MAGVVTAASQTGRELATGCAHLVDQLRDQSVAGRGGANRGDEVVTSDRYLVADGEVVQAGDRPDRDALESSRCVGQSLSKSTGRLGPAGVGRERPGQAYVRQRSQSLCQAIELTGKLDRT